MSRAWHFCLWNWNQKIGNYETIVCKLNVARGCGVRNINLFMFVYCAYIYVYINIYAVNASVCKTVFSMSGFCIPWIFIINLQLVEWGKCFTIFFKSLKIYFSIKKT